MGVSVTWHKVRHTSHIANTWHTLPILVHQIRSKSLLQNINEGGAISETQYKGKNVRWQILFPLSNVMHLPGCSNSCVQIVWVNSVLVLWKNKKLLVLMGLCTWLTSLRTPWRRMGELGIWRMWVVSFRPRLLYPRERSPLPLGTQYTGIWVCPRDGLNALEQKCHWQLPLINLQSSGRPAHSCVIIPTPCLWVCVCCVFCVTVHTFCDSTLSRWQ